MNLTKILAWLGIFAALSVGLGEYLLHYSPDVLSLAHNYSFLSVVPLQHQSIGHMFVVIGLPFYFAGYLHIYQMLKTGNIVLARITLALGFLAFALGGIWIGSRVSLGYIAHLQGALDPIVYQGILDHYTQHVEILVQFLRVIILFLSLFFSLAVLRGKTQYKKSMALFNPITILIFLVIIGKLLPIIGQHILPVLMNVTHLVFFGISLYYLNHKLSS